MLILIETERSLSPRPRTKQLAIANILTKNVKKGRINQQIDKNKTVPPRT